MTTKIHLSLGLKKRMTKVLVWRVVLYVSETWALRYQRVKIIEGRLQRKKTPARPRAMLLDALMQEDEESEINYAKLGEKVHDRDTGVTEKGQETHVANLFLIRKCNYIAIIISQSQSSFWVR